MPVSRLCSVICTGLFRLTGDGAHTPAAALCSVAGFALPLGELFIGDKLLHFVFPSLLFCLEGSYRTGAIKQALNAAGYLLVERFSASGAHTLHGSLTSLSSSFRQPHQSPIPLQPSDRANVFHSRIIHTARLSPYAHSSSAMFGQQGDKSELRGATPDFLPQLSHDACTGLFTCRFHSSFRKNALFVLNVSQ